MTINEYVKQRRLELGLTRADVGYPAGMSCQNVYALEKNKRRIDKKQAETIGNILKCDSFMEMWKVSQNTPIDRNWKKETIRAKLNKRNKNEHICN